jgi:hypothetical protein
VPRYSRHVDSTCVEYLLFQKIHINNKQNKYSHTREINWIVIPWIHPRYNYPFQLDYDFHGRGKSLLIYRIIINIKIHVIINNINEYILT